MFAKFAIVLFIVPAVVLASPFESCGPIFSNPLPSRIKIAGCGYNDKVCEFHVNKAITAELTFVPKAASKELFGTAEIKLEGKWVALAHKKPVCSRLIFGKCPLEAGKMYVYKNTVTVPHTIPVGRSTTMRLRATDEKQATIACVEIDAKFVA